MRVAPVDIANKTFRRKMFGLDPEEVYDFLRDVADEMEAAARSREQVEGKLEENKKIFVRFP